MVELDNGGLTNQDVAINFFDVIINVLSKNTSKSYCIVVLGKIKTDLSRSYPFFEYVQFKNRGVVVDTKINEVQTKTIGRLFSKMIDILGASLIRVMIMDELDARTVNYLERMGVKFFNNA